jgi:hypothetical protein
MLSRWSRLKSAASKGEVIARPEPVESTVSGNPGEVVGPAVGDVNQTPDLIKVEFRLHAVYAVWC